MAFTPTHPGLYYFYKKYVLWQPGVNFVNCLVPYADLSCPMPSTVKKLLKS